MTVIAPDVNVLIYAFRADSADHEAYASWLTDALHTSRIGLADTVLSGFLRVVTHPRIFAEPTPMPDALAFVGALLASPHVEWLHQGPEAWRHLARLSQSDNGIRGNLVPDAHLAALCLANGARLATRDRGFARFENLRFFDPAAPAA